MRRSQSIALFSLSIVFYCCFFSEITHGEIAVDNKEEKKMIDVMSELKSQIIKRIWWSDPDDCKIIRYQDAWLKGRPVFCIIDGCGFSVVLAKDEKEGWIRLSGGGDFSGMNKLLVDYMITKDELHDTVALVKFARIFLELYLNPFDEVLIKKYESHTDMILKVMDHNENVDVKALCKNPEAVIDDELLTIKFNVFSTKGSVERLTISGKHLDDHITVEQVSTTVLRPIGSFLYDFAGY